MVSAAAAIPPVFVVSTGRCGSTMLSDMLNLHPRVLSLSEFFSFVGMGSFRRRTQTGARMWELCSRQQNRTRLMLKGDYSELIYPFDDPDSRYSRADVPPIMCATLPHLAKRPEALFDELEPVIAGEPRQPPADHFRHLFEWLRRRLDRDVWAERSGGSLLFAARLTRAFPNARIIHMYRDGRETALSMSRHYLFRMIVATMRAFRSYGMDVMKSMARGRLWNRISLWMELFTSRFMSPERLPYHKLTLADFGEFWSAMIERGERMFAQLPPERLLNVGFEDAQANPEDWARRVIRFTDPRLEDEEWIRAASQLPRPTPSRFAALADDDKAALAEACRPGMERLGYPT